MKPDNERAMTSAVSNYNAQYLRILSNEYGGDSTINEVRVINSIVRAYFCGRDVGVSDIADESGISKSTVSRAVSKLERQGLVYSEVSCDDGRRRYVRLSRKLIASIQEKNLFLFRFWVSVLGKAYKSESAAAMDSPDR